MRNHFGAALFLVMVTFSMVVEGKPTLQDSGNVSVGCSTHYSSYCTCEETEFSPSFAFRQLSCNVSNSRELDQLRKQFLSDSTSEYFTVSLIMTSTLDIPADVLGGKKVSHLELSCSDRSTPLGPIHVDAFKSTQTYTTQFEITKCDLKNISLDFLSKFTSMTQLEFNSTSVQGKVDLPLLRQLKLVRFTNTTNFQSWYLPSQTPNLEYIVLSHMPDLDDRKVDSILSSMTKNLTYPKLKELTISHNALTRVPPLVSTFPGLEELDLSFNPIKTLAKDSVSKGVTQLKALDFTDMQLTTIEPGAFVGDFSLTRIYLNDNPIKNLPSSSFKDLINNSGGIYLWQNRFDFDCNLIWLLVDNRNLLRKIKGGVATNGINFEDLNPKELNC